MGYKISEADGEKQSFSLDPRKELKTESFILSALVQLCSHDLYDLIVFFLFGVFSEVQPKGRSVLDSVFTLNKPIIIS